VFDGADYIYGSNATHINRYQVSNGALTSLAVTGGTSHLSLDNKYIYAGSSTASTTPKINIIPRSTFASFTSNTLSVAITSSHFGVPKPDYTGYVHVTTHGTSITNQIQKLSTYNSDTAVQTNIVNDHVYAGVANSSAQLSALHIDYQTNRFYFAKLIPSVSTTQYSRIFELSNTFTTISNSLQYAAGTPTNSSLQNDNRDLVANSISSTWTSSVDVTRELVMIPRRGLWYMSPQYTSGSISTNASGVAGIFNIQWADATTPAYPIRFSPSPTPTLSPYGYSYYNQTTNGPRTFLAGGAMTYTKNWYNTTSVSGFATGRLTLKG
jgi:hypothetical protein